MRYIALLIAILISISIPAKAEIIGDENDFFAQKIVRVALSPSDPFVIWVDKNTSQGVSEHWDGFDIELWAYIAKENNWTTEFVPVEFEKTFETIQSGKADAGLSNISVTEEREKIVDFSHPYMETGLGILVNGKNILHSAGLTLLSASAVAFFALLCTTMIFRNTNKFVSGTCWSGAVVALLGIAWGWGNMNVAPAHINSTAQIAGKKIGVVKGTTSASAVEDYAGVSSFYATTADACSALGQGEVNAIVADAPELQHYCIKHPEFHMSGPIFDLQNYGIALQEGSSLREPINRTILLFRTSPEYVNLCVKYFGNP